MSVMRERSYVVGLPVVTFLNSDDCYTSNPTHLRISRDWPDGWMVDGADDFGNYTLDYRTFDTFQEAVDFMPEFVRQTTEDGVVWRFYEGRRGSIYTPLVAQQNEDPCPQCQALGIV